jgi:hypothetical protein
MIRAVFRAGVRLPLDPVPPAGSEGLELHVERAGRLQDIDRACAAIESLCLQMPVDPADEQRLDQALVDAERIAKEQTRRAMGLNGLA